ncbi:hypothetical protein SDC9_207034 [bioreactor metagenome]|uniref:Uncharacterized protein n=1 Tax=bioreactor metagenome TaxID=1076179 RepID=A0A645JI72_9ZZZZ
MVGNRTFRYCKIGDAFQLILIPIHDCSMDLKRQADFTAIAHTLNSAFPGSRKLPKLVVFFLVH